MVRITLLATTLVLVTSCSRKEDIAPTADPSIPSFAELVDDCGDQPGREMEPPGIYDNGGCGFQYYTTGQFGEGDAPPGQHWRYCVCGDMPTFFPTTAPLGSGWTYPQNYCRENWAVH